MQQINWIYIASYGNNCLGFHQLFQMQKKQGNTIIHILKLKKLVKTSYDKTLNLCFF